MPDQWLILALIGFAAGIFSGLFGIGGGVIIVPALTFFVGFGTVEAISTSLAALLLPVGIFAVIAYYRAHLLDVKSAVLMAAGLLITSYFGALITLGLPVQTLKQIYGLFLLYMAWRFIEPRKIYVEWAQGRQARAKGTSAPVPPSALPPALPDEEAQPTQQVSWYVVFGVGLLAGVASGMFGIGGGAVIVPALVGLLKYDQKLAVGTSLGALMLPVGLPGVLAYAAEGVLDLPVAALVALGLLIGAVFGARIALNLPSKTVKRLYGLFLVFVALRFIFG